MKVLVFKDKTSASFTDTSTILDCVYVASTFAELDGLKAKFTEENLKGATFDGERVENIIPGSLSAEYDGTNVVAHFKNTQKSEMAVLTEQVEELQSAVAEMAGMIIPVVPDEEEEEEKEEVEDNE